MKLAEALAERSDCQKRLEEIRDRLASSARIQEGEEPAENPSELLSETNGIYVRLRELISAINRTNSRTPFDKERSISDVITERDLIGKAAQVPVRSRGLGRLPLGPVLEVRSSVCHDRAGRRAAVRGGSARQAVSRARPSDSGTQLEDGIDLSGW